MKKRIIPILLVLVMLVTILSGCNIISVNADRDKAQVVAKVVYKDMSSVVTKGQLIDAFNSYGSFYIQYYGYTYEETYDEITNQLAQRKLLLLVAKDALSASKGLDVKTVKIEDLLTDAEKDKAIDAYNKTMNDLLKKFVEEIEKEKEAAKNEGADKDEPEEEDKEKVLEPRPTRPEDTSKEFDPNAAPEGGISTRFDKEPAPTDEVKAEALKRLNKRLTKLNKTYDELLNEEMENVLLESYKRYITRDIVVSDAELKEVYDKLLAQNKENYIKDSSAYEKALAGDLSSIIYHPENKYFMTLNILLKFSAEQEAEFKALKESGLYTKEELELRRQAIADKITVNVSNLEYDANADCTCATKPEEGKEHTDPNCKKCAYIRRDVPVATIISEIKADLDAIKNDGTLTGKQRMIKLKETFTQWMYKVNDDPGMFDEKNAGGYLVTTEGKSTYVDEFTDHARELRKQGLGAYEANEKMAVTTDYGMHIIFVNYIPFDESMAGLVNAVDKTISLDYIVKYDREKALTLREVLLKSKKDSLANSFYDKHISKIYKDNEKNIETYKKVYKKLYKDLDKELAKQKAKA